MCGQFCRYNVDVQLIRSLKHDDTIMSLLHNIHTIETLLDTIWSRIETYVSSAKLFTDLLYAFSKSVSHYIADTIIIIIYQSIAFRSPFHSLERRFWPNIPLDSQMSCYWVFCSLSLKTLLVWIKVLTLQSC